MNINRLNRLITSIETKPLQVIEADLLQVTETDSLQVTETLITSN